MQTPTSPVAGEDEISMRVIPINEHLLCFYRGRPAPPGDPDADFGAYNVGVSAYVIHQGPHALVFDTFSNAAQAQYVRDYMVQAGAHHFVVVNSHSHDDHVGGNSVYAQDTIIATERTRQDLLSNGDAVEGGTTAEECSSEPPQLQPCTVGISHPTVCMVGDIKTELRPIEIHTEDSLVLYLPAKRLLLAGDTVEDTVPGLYDADHIPQYYTNLQAMKQWDIDKILPSHGNPDVIAAGGYAGTALITASSRYMRRMVERSHDPDFLSRSLESFVDDDVRKGTVSVWWAYRDMHKDNLEAVAEAWANRQLPNFVDHEP